MNKQGIIKFWSAAQAFLEEIHNVTILVKYLVHGEIVVSTLPVELQRIHCTESMLGNNMLCWLYMGLTRSTHIPKKNILK